MSNAKGAMKKNCGSHKNGPIWSHTTGCVSDWESLSHCILKSIIVFEGDHASQGLFPTDNWAWQRHWHKCRALWRNTCTWTLSDGLAQVFLEMYCGLRLLTISPSCLPPTPTLFLSGTVLHCSLPAHPTPFLLLSCMFPLIKVCTSPISTSVSQKTRVNTRLMQPERGGCDLGLEILRISGRKNLSGEVTFVQRLDWRVRMIHANAWWRYTWAKGRRVHVQT